MRTDGRTDMMNLIIALRSFAKVPKKCNCYSVLVTWRLHCQNKFGTVVGGKQPLFIFRRAAPAGLYTFMV